MSDLAYRDLFVSGSRKENTNQIETAPESVAYNNYTNNSEKNQ